MSRRPARVTQADIRRALAALKIAGSNMALEILPDGTIRLTPALAKPSELEEIRPRKGIVL